MGNLTNTYATAPVSEQDAQKVATYNALAQILDSAIAGKHDISTTGGTTTLTGTPAAPQAQNMMLNVTGTLTSNATIEIPVAATTGRNRLYVVKNGTTGAFSLTVKKVGGTGVTVAQGAARLVYYDGSDIAYAAPVAAFTGARVYHNAAQSISSGVTTALAFNSERYDTDAQHDTATNNSRLTCKMAGKYLISGSLSWDANATGMRQHWIRLNGTITLAENDIPSVGASVVFGVVLSTQYELAVGDYLEMMVFQDSGGALNVRSASNYSPEFMFSLI